MFSKRSLAILAAVMLMLSALLCPLLPAVRAEASADAAGGSYNANDLEKLLSFLEQSDKNGKKNGSKLNAGYDPALPETWCSPAEAGESGMNLPAILWREIEGEKRLVRLELPFMCEFTGRLDLSDCAALEHLSFRDNRISEVNLAGCRALTSLIGYRNELTCLDVSDCPLLETLAIQHNSVSSIDVSNNPMLSALCCDGNGIAALDLSGNPALTELRCEGNGLTRLELMHNPKLDRLWTVGNPLKELDLSGNEALIPSKLFASGEGSVGYYGNDGTHSVIAERHGGSEFVGWFDASGKCISTAASLRLDSTSPAELIAVFASPGTTPAFPAERTGGGLSPLQLILPAALAGAAAAAAGMLIARRMNKNGDENR